MLATLSLPGNFDIRPATLDDVQAFFREYYVPANAVLTIVGDFDREPTKALIRKYFAGIAAGKRAPAPAAPMPTLLAVKHLTKTDDVKLPRVYLAWHTPADGQMRAKRKYSRLHHQSRQLTTQRTLHRIR